LYEFNRLVRLLIGVFAVLPCVPAAVHAETYPNRSIRLIVPTGAGGASDTFSRIIAQKLAERLKQPVVPENRAGARGMIGAEFVSHALPDGYTLLWGASDIPMIPMLVKSAASFNVSRDLVPIAGTASTFGSFVVNPKVPAKTLPEFVAYAKASPGKIKYGTNGIGGSLYMAAKILEVNTGIELLHVPYRATVQVIVDAISGEIEMAPLALSSAAANQSRLRVLAQTGPVRHPLLPDVPTTAEAGMPEVSLVYWWGLFAPPGTPAAIVEVIERELKVVLSEPDIKKSLETHGADPAFVPTAPFVKQVEEERLMWIKLIPKMGLQPE
jgi:tripartite-type tricarboxylate transporter receptor subunit TctC